MALWHAVCFRLTLKSLGGGASSSFLLAGSWCADVRRHQTGGLASGSRAIDPLALRDSQFFGGCTALRLALPEKPRWRRASVACERRCVGTLHGRQRHLSAARESTE